MDTTIYRMMNGKMTKVGDTRLPNNCNFIITCSYGDWSGFRTLAECESQFAELEQAEKDRPGRGFEVVER